MFVKTDCFEPTLFVREPSLITGLHALLQGRKKVSTWHPPADAGSKQKDQTAFSGFLSYIRIVWKLPKGAFYPL